MQLPAWIATLFSALAAALLPACDVINLPRLEPGVTTQAEVRSRMGEPGFVHHDPDGSVTWEYSRQPAGKVCYMIRFDSRDIVAAVDQVLTPAGFARALPGLSQDEVRRLYGQPAKKQVFRNLGEEIWEWHVEGQIATEETYFSVHFGLADGRLRKAGLRVEPGGR